MSKVVNIRLSDEQIARLDQAADRARRTRSEMAAIFVEEHLRLAEFPFIAFRDTAVGREAHVAGTRFKVWRIAELARDVNGDTAWIAEHLEVPEHQIKAVLNYAAAFAQEMEDATKANEFDLEELQRQFPNLEAFTVDLTAADAPAS